MAIVYAVKSGNWSDTTVWNTGALPTASDDVRSNNFTVAVDGNYTVLTVSNKSETSPVVTAGGTFTLNNGVTLTCTASTGFPLLIANAIIFSLNSPQSSIINGNITVNAMEAVIHSGTGTLSINGNITVANVNVGGAAVNLTGTGILNVVGNCTTGSFNPYHSFLRNSSTGTINLTGNATGYRNGSWGAHNQGTGYFNIIGNVYGGPDFLAAWYGYGASNTAAGIMSITGSVYGGAGSNNQGAINTSTGTLIILGPVFGSLQLPSGQGATFGASNTSSGTMQITGSLYASSYSPAVFGGSATGNTSLSGPFLAGTNGVVAIQAVRWLWKQADQQPTYMQVRVQGDLTLRNLYTADSVGGNPATNNVRAGTVYGPLNELTGTMAVPSANSVGFGVPVDNTTGTQALSPQDVWNVLTSTLTTNGSIGERLNNSASVAAVAAIVASFK